MSNIKVYFVNFNENAPCRGYWDMYWLEAMFSSKRFEIFENVEPTSDYGIVIIPGRQNINNVDRINTYIANFKGVLVIITGDEESQFPHTQLKHSNMKLWVMAPHAGNSYPNVDKFIGTFITPHCELLPERFPEKDLKWFFAGQITHPRRLKCAMELRRRKDGLLVESPGFTQGLAPEEYIKNMARAMVIPCPSGPETPDTFRFYEALESACIPIADEISPKNRNQGYWNMIFGEDFELPKLLNWRIVHGLIDYNYDVYNTKIIDVFSWWLRYKRDLYYSLLQDFAIVSGMNTSNEITVIVPTSPVPSNPDTSFIEETISTIRTHLPEAEIIITFDGVREEQKEIEPKYFEYIRNVLWLANRKWKNVYPLVFKEHNHQVGMCREAMKYVKTDKILYVEHDAPLTPDEPIEWEGVFKMIDSGQADMVRFHFEAHIPEVHQEMMLDKEPLEVCGIKAVRTFQWSQRPHVASTKFYNRILNDHFTPGAKTFIEDKMHGVVVSAYRREQLQGWNKFKLWIYHPDGQIKRSYHTDARGQNSKYDDKLVF